MNRDAYEDYPPHPLPWPYGPRYRRYEDEHDMERPDQRGYDVALYGRSSYAS